MHRLNALGGLRIEFNGEPVHEFGGQRKRLALLALLAVAGENGLPRDKVLALLWPDATTAHGRNALNQLVHRLRNQFGDDAVTANNGDIALGAMRFSSDVADFVTAVQRNKLSEAVALYRGPFLDGFHLPDTQGFDEWCERERTRFAALHATAIENLARDATRRGDATEATRWWCERSLLEPLNERVARAYCAATVAAGERSSALRHAATFSAAVREETGDDPEAVIRTFVLELPTPTPVVAAPQRPAPSAVAAPRRSWRTHALRAALAVPLLGLAVMLRSRGPAPIEASATFPAGFPDSTEFLPSSSGGSMAVSPNGTEIAYVGGTKHPRIFLRALNELAARPIEGTEGGTLPEFSPNGEWIAFKVGGTLNKVRRSGGHPAVIADSVKRFSWGDNDVIAFHAAKRTGLWQIRASGGASVSLTKLDPGRGETKHTWPFVLPGGGAVLFNIEQSDSGTPEIAAVRIADGEVMHFGVRGFQPRVVDGLLLYGDSAGSVLAATFDVRKLRITSPAVRVLQHVAMTDGGGVIMAISRTGTMAYVDGALTRRLVAVDRAGRSHALMDSAETGYMFPRYSPDGTRLALSHLTPDGSNVWVYDIRARALSQVTRDGVSDGAHWLPDGLALSWHSRAAGADRIVRGSADGRGEQTVMFDHAVDLAMSPNSLISAVVTAHDPPWREVRLATSSSTEREPLVAMRGSTFAPQVSPNGRWVALASDATGTSEVLVVSLDGDRAIHQVSKGDAHQPVWSRDGRELFFRTQSKVVSATIDAGPRFRLVRIDTLFRDSFVRQFPLAEFDVSPDGREFVFTQVDTRNARPIVKMGWIAEVRARLTAPALVAGSQ